MADAGFPTLPLAQELLERVIATCDRFEADWRGGGSPRIEDHVIAATGSERPVLLRELLAIEVELRIARGEHPDPSEYRGRFPDLATVVDATFAELAAALPRPSGSDPPRFRVLRLHAWGGLGQVSVALDRELHREVALKEIRPEMADHPESRARFVLEAEVTGQLEHPGIVPVYGFGVDAAGRPYYAMRMVQGKTLRQAIENLRAAPAPTRKLEFRKLLGKFVAVCDAVAYAHSRGVLHRDIKPDNILLGPYGETLVVDWGLAKVFERGDEAAAGDPGWRAPTLSADSDATVAGTTLGTPGYMSPEQAAGEIDRLGPRSDVYGLGATLYVLLTGRGPSGKADGGMPTTTLADAVRPSRSPGGRIPPALGSICAKAMHPRPEGRYATARLLADDIERWLADEPVSAHREGLGGRLSRWLRRHRARAAAAVLALVAVSLVSIAAAVLVDAERRRADGERDDARRLAARLAYERAWTAHEGNDQGAGLLWLGRALELTDPGAELEQRRIRVTMEAWRPSVCRRLLELNHGQVVESVAISPDGTRLLTAGGRRVCLWDAADGRPVGAPLRHPDDLLFAALGVDGATIATAARDGRVRLWEAETGELLAETKPAPIATALAIAPDGATLATGHNDGIRLWGVPSGRPLGQVVKHPMPVQAVVYSPDGQTVFTGGKDKILRAWGVADGRARGVEIATHSPIHRLAGRPDGGAMATALEDRTVQVRGLTDGKVLFLPSRHKLTVRAVAFGPDGAAILTGSQDTTAQLWDAGSGLPIGETLRHPTEIRHVAIGPDGRTALLAVGTRAWLWSLPDGPRDGRRLVHGGPVTSIAFSPDGTKLATGGKAGQARLWDVASGRPIGPALDHGPFLRALAFHPRRPILATASSGGDARLWDSTDGRPLGPPLPHRRGVFVHGLDFHPDGRVLATGGDDREVRLWGPAGEGGPGRVLPHPDHVSCVRFSPDGRTLLAGGGSGSARLWDPTDGRLLHEWHHQERARIRAAAFSPDGRVVATAGNDRAARLWDIASGRPLAVLRHEGEIFDVEFRPDGRMVATCGFDGVVRLWGWPGGRRVAETARAVGPVLDLAFSPDGSTVASSGVDGAARLWDSSDGLPVGRPFLHGAGIWAVAFHPEGKILATAGADGTARLWDLPRPLPGGVDELVGWTSLWTQRTLTDSNSVEPLGLEEWRRRYRASRGLTAGLPLPEQASPGQGDRAPVPGGAKDDPASIP
jgi:eukaryotic-like serine/threonine-protein kinase